ncbi:MAG: hypothetical protein KJZ85_10005 [Rhodobacteraceae bacterium]|jgi:hypothetical protein|nr:hypothetical protein [Paracoccaceae bacterium]
MPAIQTATTAAKRDVATLDVAALEREAARLRAETLAAGFAAAFRWLRGLVAGRGSTDGRTA